MFIDPKVAWSAGGALLVALWTGCTCDPVYPPEAGDSCSAEGDRTCEFAPIGGDSLNVLICAENARWVVEIACDDFWMVCREPEGEPMCTDWPCEEGQTRCTMDYTQVIVCNFAEEWLTSEVCDGGSVCVVEGDAAKCGDARCEEGATRCSSDEKQIETCDVEGDWVATSTCPPGTSCQVRVAVATCTETQRICSADTLLDQRCNPEDELWIQECENVGTSEGPIYEWVNSLDCSTLTPDYVCQQEGDEAPFCLPAM